MPDENSTAGASAEQPQTTDAAPQAPPTPPVETAASQEVPTAAPTSPVDDIMLDLDELKPSGKKIRVGGKIVEIGQPDTGQLLDLIRIGKSLEGMTRDNYNMDTLQEALKQTTEIAKSLAPELADYKLNIVQALALINLLQGIAMPDRLKELQKRGITAAEAPKGAAS